MHFPSFDASLMTGLMRNKTVKQPLNFVQCLVRKRNSTIKSEIDRTKNTFSDKLPHEQIIACQYYLSYLIDYKIICKQMG